MPTGALVEYGSNANGEFFRFVGGLQVCAFTGMRPVSPQVPYGPGFYSSTYWDFPALFGADVVIPSVLTLYNNAANWTSLQQGGLSRSKVTSVVLDFYSRSDPNLFMAAVAVGRWHD